MRLTTWTISLCSLMRVQYFWMEQVPAVLTQLPHSDIHACELDLSFYLPQPCKQAVIANFPFQDLLPQPSAVPMPASFVLPHVPDGSFVSNKYHFSVPINSPLTHSGRETDLRRGTGPSYAWCTPPAINPARRGQGTPRFP